MDPQTNLLGSVEVGEDFGTSAEGAALRVGPEDMGVAMAVITVVG